MMNIKTDRYSKDEGQSLIKPLLISFVLACSSCVLMLILMSFVFSATKVAPYNLLSSVTVVINAITGFVAGFSCAKIHKRKGLAVGALSAFIVFIPILLSGVFYFGNDVSLTTLIKFAVIIISGGIGGILGVNQKVKVEI